MSLAPGLCRCAAIAVGLEVVAAWAQQTKPVDIRAETMQGIAELLAPYQGARPGSPDEARALDALRKEGLLRPPQPRPKDDLADRLGTALALGTRAHQFLPELAKVSDAIAFGTDQSVRDAITELWQKAGRAAPTGTALDRLVADARAAKAATSAASQHVTISRPAYVIKFDRSPPAGKTTIDVVSDGADGKPERVVFSGDTLSRPRADGGGIELATRPEPPRLITEETAAAWRARLNGRWIDQEGLVWEIAGEGNDVTATQIGRNGHRVAYPSHWALGLISGAHLVNDVLDMGDDLPADVRQQLADTYHPPFTIRLDYKADHKTLSGQWISGTVTYGGMAHTVKIVEDPTWDKPLILSRSAPTVDAVCILENVAPFRAVDELPVDGAFLVEVVYTDDPGLATTPVVVTTTGGGHIEVVATRVEGDPKRYRTNVITLVLPVSP